MPLYAELDIHQRINAKDYIKNSMGWKQPIRYQRFCQGYIATFYALFAYSLHSMYNGGFWYRYRQRTYALGGFAYDMAYQTLLKTAKKAPVKRAK